MTSVLWRVAKCLFYIEEARCLKVNECLQKHHHLGCRFNTSRELEPRTVRSGARILAGTRNVQTAVDPPSPLFNGLRSEAAGERSWPLTSIKCRCLPMSGDLCLHVVYRDRFKNTSFWSFAACDASWTQQIRLCLQHATVVTSVMWRQAKRRLQTVARSRSLLKVEGSNSMGGWDVAWPSQCLGTPCWVLLRGGDCTGQSPGLLVCFFLSLCIERN